MAGFKASISIVIGRTKHDCQLLVIGSRKACAICRPHLLHHLASLWTKLWIITPLLPCAKVLDTAAFIHCYLFVYTGEKTEFPHIHTSSRDVCIVHFLLPGLDTPVIQHGPLGNFPAVM